MFPKFDWLLFDLDNTLVDFNSSSKDAFVQVMTHLGVEDASVLYPIFNKINHQCWDEREAGLISHTELKNKRWVLFFEAAKIKADPLSINESYFEIIKTNPVWMDDAERLLIAIQNKFNNLIITNGLSEVQNPRIKKLDMAKYFGGIIISDEIGTAKPQKQFFSHCASLMGEFDNDKVLVIGDTLKSDIKGGNEFGFRTCWYNYYKKENDTDIKPNYEVNNIKSLGVNLGVW